MFLKTRGARFTTPGTGLSQAPPSGGAQGGLAGLFGNPTYGDIFTTFSALAPVHPGRQPDHRGFFFVPGTNGIRPADGDGLRRGLHGRRQAERGPEADSTRSSTSTPTARRIFTGSVPSSPGDASLSFFGVVFDEARIARMRITTGDSARARTMTMRKDIVMMDDFIYGEPQPGSELRGASSGSASRSTGF